MCCTSLLIIYSFILCSAGMKVCVGSLPEHKAGLVERGPASPHSGLNRRTCAWAAGSHFPPLPAPWRSCCDPTSSLPSRYKHSVSTCTKTPTGSFFKDVSKAEYCSILFCWEKAQPLQKLKGGWHLIFYWCAN